MPREPTVEGFPLLINTLKRSRVLGIEVPRNSEKMPTMCRHVETPRHLGSARKVGDHEWHEPQAFKTNPFNEKSWKPQDIKQVWFAGIHADIGGSCPEPESGLSKFALLWMMAGNVALQGAGGDDHV